MNGAATRHSSCLASLQTDSVCSLCPQDADRRSQRIDSEVP